MAKFTWGDRLRIRDDAPAALRPGAIVWVTGVHEGETRRGSHFEIFPEGTVYAIEYEDASFNDVHEDDLTKIDDDS
jgi:hypothetical protein